MSSNGTSCPSTRIRHPGPSSSPYRRNRNHRSRGDASLPDFATFARRRLIDPVFALLVASRWLHFASVSIVFGGSLFWLFIGRRPARAGLRSLPATATNTIRLLRGAALVGALSGVGWLASTIANISDDPSNMLDAGMLHVFFFETPFGAPAFVRLVLLTALALSAVLPLGPSGLIASDIVLGGGLLASQAWLGHAAGGTGFLGLSMIASYAVHVMSGAAWIGSLPVLAFAIAERRRQGEASGDILMRYSIMAVVAVGLIVFSGIANSLFHADRDFEALASSRYGKILLAKVALVAAMLALAAINRFVMMPRLDNRIRADSGTTRLLQTSIALEMLLAIFILGGAATLGVTAPSH